MIEEKKQSERLSQLDVHDAKRAICIFVYQPEIGQACIPFHAFRKNVKKTIATKQQNTMRKLTCIPF